jgi:GNAT superfamily N-acetyltransferase
VEPAIRELTAEEWPEAARVCGRAIWNEPYMVPALGEEPLGRLAAMLDIYLRGTPPPERLVLGAFAGPHLIGVAMTSRPGDCRPCATDPLDAPPKDDPVEVSFFDLDVLVQGLHQSLPTAHWRVGPLAVEPGLQGVGIGRRLLEVTHERAWAEDPATVALECDPSVVPFYERVGYREVSRATGADGFDIVAMRIDRPS